MNIYAEIAVGARVSVNEVATRAVTGRGERSPLDAYVGKNLLESMTPLPVGKKPRSAPSLIGTRTGRLVVVGWWGGKTRKAGGRSASWVCRCVCGVYTVRTTASVRADSPHNMCNRCARLKYLQRHGAWRDMERGA